MSKRILAVLLIALISLFSFTACKTESKKGNNAKASNSAFSEENGGNSSSKSGKDSEENGNGASKDSGGSSDSQSSSDSAEGSSKNDGWKQQEPGTVVKGDVKVNVVKYQSAKLSDGQQLIEELIKGGMNEIEEVISKQKSDNSVVYRVHGIRKSEKEPEFIKLQFVSKENTGYIVTVLAKTQSDMDTDISYILDNLKDLAQ